MRKYTIILLFLCTLNCFSQLQVGISGFVKDKASGELLIGANIFEPVTNKGTVSDNNGYFNIIVQTPVKLEISFTGYQTIFFNHNCNRDTLIYLFLEPGNELDEVVVKAHRLPKLNIETLSIKELQAIPSIGGKPDVAKSLQLLPGITSQNEGSSVLLVRGGDPGQNLYLFDNVPIIYVNHLGGFTSVFNPDIINHVDVYKGGFPARYGGKLSSIVDVAQREGDKSGLKGSFGIGVTDASFTVEGPVAKKNMCFILTGRKTMTDALMALASKLSEGNNYIIAYGFHDINGKITWKPNERNSLNLNFYQGDDYLNYWTKSNNVIYTGKNHLTNIWGNWMISTGWNSVVSSKLFASNTISYTRYRLKETKNYSITNQLENEEIENKYLSSVQDISLRSGWKYMAIDDWSIDFGLASSFLQYTPNYLYISNQMNQYSSERIESLQSATYVDNKIKLLSNFEADAGIRFVHSLTEGYTDYSLEPRLNLSFNAGVNHKLNTSFMHITQYSHLIFTNGDIMKNEVWVPVGINIPPSTANQYTIGWSSNFMNNMFTAEINTYYKKMNGLSTYKEGYFSLRGDENWRSKIESGGIGTAKGFESLIRKNYGKWSGFASYSLSNATRKFPNINDGVEFLYDFDRLHTISINTGYKLNENISFNLAWVYQSGLPYTPAIGRQYAPSLKPNDNGDFFFYDAFIYGKRNSERMKDYHRLDVSLNYIKKNSKNRTVIWNLSIYNAYNRHNPYYYYFNTNNTDEIYIPEFGEGYKPVSLYQVSFFPIIPSISYKLFFDGSNLNKKNQKEEKQKTTIKQKLYKWLFYEN